MDSSELPAGPIDVDSDTLTAIDPSQAEPTPAYAAVLNDHYTKARARVTEARGRYDWQKGLAAEGPDPTTRGEHGAFALRAHYDWTHWLGAVAALERLADELQVELDDDRRPYLRPEDRK